MNGSKSVKFLWLIKLTLLILSILYMMQLFSPLRLNKDAIVFLSLSQSFINGQGLLYNGLPTHFPPGYPALLSLLYFIGLGYSWVFIATNLAFLAIGNTMLFYICYKRLGFNKAYSYSIIIFTLLSWVIIKHVTLPISDLTYYGLSMAAIGTLSYAESSANKHWRLFFVVGILLGCLAVMVRTVGIAIYAALIFQGLHKKTQTYKGGTISWIRNHIFISILLSVVFISIIISVINIKYFTEALQAYHNYGGFLNGTFLIWVDRLRELGELGVNVSITKIPETLAQIIPIIGLAFLGALIYIIYNRHDNYILVDYYIVAYVLIIFFWPYKDPRFWLPIVPLLICMLAILVQKVSISRLMIAAFCTYLIIFSFMGIAALGYNTRISLAGPRFPDLYSDNDGLRNAYRIFLSKEDQAKNLPVNEEALHLLRRFSNIKEQK